MKRTFFYNTENEDVVFSKNQNFDLPDNFEWNSKTTTIFSRLTVDIAKIIGYVYRYQKHVVYRDETTMNLNDSNGCFVYSNHTQTFGDVFLPFNYAKNHKLTILVSPSNLGIPIIGTMIPSAGGLIIPSKISQMKKFKVELNKRINDNQTIFIYPEQHVWPYCTTIRPLNFAAFHYPAANNTSVYCFTTTYQKRKYSKKPKITIFIDGPFLAPECMNRKEKQRFYQTTIESCMKRRASFSTYEYVKYRRLQQ
ncbi:hypothetical protein [Companilactobacillus jidongensis]|uniref:hypothetical protein n=1 Tax=Companilactobacillus jidongensis TaxID=2486006 RepID=UPI000F783BBF|nr:hypothetical protein [Companilactobacillus jidongensis]